MSDIKSYFSDKATDDTDDIFSQIAKSTSNLDLEAVAAAAHKEVSASGSDSFVQSNPAERLWFPSPETVAIIERVRKSPSCREEPDVAASRTVPVVYAEKQTDPIRDQLLLRNRSESVALRSFPNASTVSKDLNGLKQLINAKCFRSALNLTAELLAHSMSPSANSPGHMSWLSEQEHLIWACRFTLLVRLGLAGVAEIEMQPFSNGLDNADLYQEFFPEYQDRFASSNVAQLVNDSYTSLVPFATRLLFAQLPMFLQQRYGEALDRLSGLLRSIDKILSKIDPKLVDFRSIWERRREDVLFAMANVLVAQKNYREAHDIFELVLAGNGPEKSVRKCRIAAMAGRSFLQSGCLPLAEQFFKRAETNEKVGAFLTDLHSGYLSMAAGQFHDATDHFEHAVSKAPDDQLKVQAVTCVAVSIMYSGRLQAAIDRLEGALFAEPQIYSTEPFLINLATMYELYQSNTADARKLKLLDLVGQYCGDGFDLSCLKLSPVAAATDPSANSLPTPPPVVPPNLPPPFTLPGPLQPPQSAPNRNYRF